MTPVQKSNCWTFGIRKQSVRSVDDYTLPGGAPFLASVLRFCGAFDYHFGIRDFAAISIAAPLTFSVRVEGGKAAS